MASPQKENGFTAIANEILEKLVYLRITASEKDILFFVIRKTYGFHKKKDKISLSQFELGTGLSRPTVVMALKNLVFRNLLVKTPLLEYSFNKDWETWVVKTPLLVKYPNTTSKLTLTKSGKDTLTHKRKKKYTKEISKTNVSQIMKKNSFNYKETNHEDSYEDSIDIDTNEYFKAPKEQTKKYPNAKSIFTLFGKYPANWKINKTQLQAAENLYLERGVDQVLKAINFYRDNKQDKFCPVINSPYDLDSKWAKLISFKKKL